MISFNTLLKGIYIHFVKKSNGFRKKLIFIYNGYKRLLYEKQKNTHTESLSDSLNPG